MMKSVKKLALPVAILFCLTAWSGCTEDPPPALSYKDREMIDSLFRMKIDTLRPYLDSLCEARTDSMVKRNADSIMDERLGEIQRYLERIRQEEQSSEK